MKKISNSKRENLQFESKQNNMNNNLIYNILNGNIILEENYKEKGNFIYIYDEISNLFELFSDNLKIIREGLHNLYVKKLGGNCEYTKSLMYIKEYLLLYNNTLFTIRIEEELVPISICRDEVTLFNLPIFDVNNISITLIQNGISRDILIRKNKLRDINSSIIKEAMSNIEIFVYSNGLLDNGKCYYDNVLECEEDSFYIDHQIKRFLEKKFNDNCIKVEDLEFTQNINTIISIEEEECKLMFDYNTSSYIARSKEFLVRTGIKTLVNELSNNSKVKIVITRKKSVLANKQINLKDFVYDILKKDYMLEIKSIVPKAYTEPLILSFGERLEEYRKDRGLFNFIIDYEIRNMIALPVISRIISYDDIKDPSFSLIDEQTIFKEEKKDILLKQYYYMETESCEKKEKYIISLLFKFKKLITSYKGKTFSAIVPCYIKKECFKNKLFDDVSLSLIKKYIDIDTVCVDRSFDIQYIEYEQNLKNRTILSANPEIMNFQTLNSLHNYTLFGNKKEIKFFDVGKSIPSFEKFHYVDLDMESFKELECYFKK